MKCHLGRYALALGCLMLLISSGACARGAGHDGDGAAPLPLNSAGPIRGVEPIADTLPWYDPEAMTVSNASERMLDEPVELLLPRYRYPAADGHLDAVLWLAAGRGDTVDGVLEVALLDGDGQAVSEDTIDPIPDSRLFFAFDLPERLNGRSGTLRVRWRDAGEVAGEATAPFTVDEATDPPAREGRIDIRVPNTTGATLRGAPVSVGVPFPRGALDDPERVRLLDAEGNAVPLQAKVISRWSRFGSVRWLRCDFTAELDGDEATYALEFGPGVQREDRDAMTLDAGASGFPALSNGPLEVRSTGLYFVPEDRSAARRVLEPEALHGGFVEHEDGRVFKMQPDGSFDVEQHGPEKLVVRTQGYYRHVGTGDAFCRYSTRYIVHRDSPLLRIVHTWIFTGDGNVDRISNMGWRFAMDEGLAGTGFLSSFEQGDWHAGDYLLQHEHDRHEIVGGDDDEPRSGERAPGVAAAVGNGVQLHLGVKDFWQNFPSELQLTDEALYFHNWPRHGRPARHAPATVEDAYRLWFVHEGEALDFRLPEEYTEDPIFSEAMRREGPHWQEGRPETANAQGIARTEEMWLHIGPEAQPREQATRVMQGLAERTLHPVVDPEWVAASGAFYEIHHRDVERYPAHERVYEQVALGPQRWIERVGLYGMWLYGDMMWNPYLHRQSAELYRALRKSHHGWPYSWVPFARSGDPRMLQLAQAGTRQMYDANFCHYVTDTVDRSTGPLYNRQRGVWHRSLVPWTGLRTGARTRGYQSQIEYLLHAYYLDADDRAMDVLRLWQSDVKNEQPVAGHGPITATLGPRVRTTMLQSSVEMYEASFDPWFIVLAHALAELDLAEFERDYRGHTWRPGPREFLRFTGDPEYEQAYLLYARHEGDESSTGWATQPQIEPNAYAWWITGERTFLRRLAHEVDWARQAIFEGEPDYYKGSLVRGGVSAPLFTSWYLYQLPLALAAFEAAGEEPTPLPNRYYQQAASEPETLDDGYRWPLPTVLFQKRDGEAVPVQLSVSDRLAQLDGQAHYTLHAPDGDVFAQGEWAAQDEELIELPANAPTGVYRLESHVDVSRPQVRLRPYNYGLYVPVTPEGVPEVIAAPAPRMHLAERNAQYWFRMPEDTSNFRVEFYVHGYDSATRRFSIWDADHRRVWDHHTTRHDLERMERREVVAEVDVPPDQRGRLWRLTLPDTAGGFEISTDVQPIFAISPDRWFDPNGTP